MNKKNKLSYNNLINFISCSEFIFLRQPLIVLLPKYFDEIKQKLESETDIIKFIFFNRNLFHKLLYDREEVVKIEFGEQKINLYYNFYLNLLIKENPEIINYEYSFYLIKTNNIERKKTSQKYKLIILSKIIIDLIDNYRNTDKCNENEDSFQLKEIEEENRQIIKDNIGVFKEIELNLDENDILKKKIDEIYIEIINSIIRSKKIEDFEYAYYVFEQLDLKNISLTKTIFDGLMNGQNYKDYEINNIEDINDEIKVNFYYLFLEFIFKDSIYIYNVPFLLKTRKIFLDIIKKGKFHLLKINKKIEFMFSKILDSKFYSRKYFHKIYGMLNEVLKYYEECFFETKKEDIKEIKDIIKNEKVDYEKYLEDYDKAKKINERIPIINYIYNFENKGNLRNEKNFQKAILKLDKFERMIKERKIEKEYGEIMANYIKEENDNQILSKILNNNEYDYFINYIKESNNNINNNKNANELMINKSENKKIDNPLLKNKNEINNIVYNKPLKNEEEKKYSINYKSLDTNMNSNIPEVAIIKKEENLDAVDPAINIRKENITSYILRKCSIIFHTNFKGKEPYIIYDEISYGDYNIKIDLGKLLNSKYECEHSQPRNESSENYLKLFNFLKEVEERINNEFLLDYNLKIKLDIRKEEYNNNSDSTYNISCIYTFYDPINNSAYTYKDENILINGTNSLNQGFQHMLYNINSEFYKNIEYQEFDMKNKLESTNNERQKQDKNLRNINSEDMRKEKELIPLNEEKSTNIQSYFIEGELPKTADEDLILEFIKIIDRNKNSAEIIYETQNGNYAIGYSNNSLLILNNKFCKIIQIRDLDDCAFSICEKNCLNKKKIDKNKIELLCCTNQLLTLVNIDISNTNYNIKTFEIQNRTNLICIEMRENNYIISGIGGTYYYVSLFNQDNGVNQSFINEKTFRSGIKISDNIIVLASNSLLPKGENKLIFYNIKSKKISKEIEGYSITIASNCLCLMPREETKVKNKIVLCACKKYKQNEKNGILLVNPQLQDNKRVKNEFYDTDNFEVYCFCPILLIENKNKIYDNIDEKYRKNIKIQDTEYFLVGGFDTERREGMIKLFKVIYGKEAFDTKIQYIQDIVIDIIDNQKIEYFEGPISCIYQSKISGNILVSCYNGTVYLFTPPNIDYYINNSYYK